MRAPQNALRTRTVGNSLGLGLLKSLPIQSQLADDMPQRAYFEVFAAPVGHRGDPPRGWVMPFAVGCAASSWQFLTSQSAQFAGDFLVSHAMTAVSIQKEVCRSSARRSSTGGKGRFRSS